MGDGKLAMLVTELSLTLMKMEVFISLISIISYINMNQVGINIQDKQALEYPLEQVKCGTLEVIRR